MQAYVNGNEVFFNFLIGLCRYFILPSILKLYLVCVFIAILTAEVEFKNTGLPAAYMQINMDMLYLYVW